MSGIVAPQRFPLRIVVREGRAAHAAMHSHEVGQLLYPEQGSTLLETQQRVIRLAPDRAAWIPRGVPHAVLMDRSFRYHSVYVEPDFYDAGRCVVVCVRPLLRELILDAASWEAGSGGGEQRLRKARVLADELASAPWTEPGIQIPAGPRIAPICRALEQDPADNRSLGAWARVAGASEKTIQRGFVTHTGMSFQQWRNHARMTRAAELHARGWRQLDIALAVGYATEGAYAQAFKKFYGYPPSRLPRGG